MKPLYHTTSAAAATGIAQRGFADSDFCGVAAGVLFADRPLDVADGLARFWDEVCVEVTVPASFDLAEFEVVEEGRPIDAYREWLVPARFVNEWPRRMIDRLGEPVVLFRG